MAVNRIHIVGGPGSGKTYLGKKIAQHLSVPVCDLDNLFWDNTANNYNTRATEEDRDKALADILSNERWVIEGVYYKWLQHSFEQADVIIIIKPNDFIRNYRLVKRFISRQLGLVPSKKDSLKGFIALLKWGQEYSRKNLPLILEFTKPYKDKRFFFKNADEAFEFLTSSHNN